MTCSEQVSGHKLLDVGKASSAHGELETFTVNTYRYLKPLTKAAARRIKLKPRPYPKQREGITNQESVGYDLSMSSEQSILAGTNVDDLPVGVALSSDFPTHDPVPSGVGEITNRLPEGVDVDVSVPGTYFFTEPRNGYLSSRRGSVTVSHVGGNPYFLVHRESDEEMDRRLASN